MWHRAKYEAWIHEQGVGSRNPRGGSIQSYVARLMRVSKELRTEIGPKTVRSRSDAEALANRLVTEKGVNERSASDCKTALNHYADMVEAKKLV